MTEIQLPNIDPTLPQDSVQDTAQDTERTTSPEESQKSHISFDEFVKVELRIGRILHAGIVEKSEKLLELSVDFGEGQPRQVVSGIRMQFQAPEELINRSFVFVTNLEPRKIMGLESQAMIVAGKGPDGLALMTPTIGLPPGTLLS